MGFQIIEWISDRSIFDWMFGLRFWGWVSWIFHGVTTEEVTFDYVDRAVLIVLVIFERFPFDLGRRMDYIDVCMTINRFSSNGSIFD